MEFDAPNPVKNSPAPAIPPILSNSDGASLLGRSDLAVK
jgi:hypothetical protein